MPNNVCIALYSLLLRLRTEMEIITFYRQTGSEGINDLYEVSGSLNLNLGFTTPNAMFFLSHHTPSMMYFIYPDDKNVSKYVKSYI